MPPNVTRLCAFVFVRAEDRVLISEMHHPVEGVFYQPPGGGVEFQELSEQAARRELLEELDLHLEPITFLGVREEIFSMDDEPYHEIGFIYEAWIERAALDALDGAPIVEDDNDVEIARVVSLTDLRGGRYAPLYPEDVLDLIV